MAGAMADPTTIPSRGSASSPRSRKKKKSTALRILAVIAVVACIAYACAIFFVTSSMTTINVQHMLDYSHFPVEQSCDCSTTTTSRSSARTSGRRGRQRRQRRRRMPNDDDEKLNIVLLYADDWRYDTLSAAGNAVVQTPHLDRLAKNGMLFTHNCVTTSICWISRGTLYTGQYVARHGASQVANPTFMDRWNETIYGLMTKNGYYTGFFGKWHHARMEELPGKFNESDYYFGKHYPVFDVRSKQHLHVTEKNELDSIRFLRDRPNKDQPFFLTTSFFATHAEDGNPKQYIPQNQSMSLYADVSVPVPPSATQESWERLPWFFTDQNEGRQRWRLRYDTPEKHQRMMKNYYRMATEVDTASGNIIKELEKQGILNKTLVIFTTDNGNFHAEHGLADKWYPHQESIRVPLVIYDPRMSKSMVGQVNSDFTLNIDLAPTLLGAAGIDAPQVMQGRDMSELYRSTPVNNKDGQSNVEDVDWRTEFFYEYPQLTGKNHIPASEALVRKDFKYIWWSDWGLEQLFHLEKDPSEENDLIADPAHWETVAEMRMRFAELKAEAR